jgi:hypothetical protein
MTEEKLAGAGFWAGGLAFLLLLAIGPALAADDGRSSNPHGAFADMNPNVTCEHASTDKPASQ